MKTKSFALCAFLFAPALANAHSILNETGVGTTQTSPTNPRSGYFYDLIDGTAELSKRVDLRLDVTLTHDASSPAGKGAVYGSSGGNIVLMAIGMDFEASRHVDLGADIDFSSKSFQLSDAPITFQISKADAQIRSAIQTYGAAFQFGYHTAGETDWETSVDSSLGWTHYSSLQQVNSVATAAGPETIQKILDACAAAKDLLAGCKQIQAAAGQQQAEVNQLRLALSVTETVGDDNDFILGGSVYLYNQDPNQIGYFSLASVGLTSMGAGVPLAPLQFTLKPEYVHRFGRFSVDVWYQFGEYASDLGTSQLLALKTQYRFSKQFSAYLLATGQRDLDIQGTHTNSGTVALGLRFRF
jgi:hypothetical protein